MHVVICVLAGLALLPPLAVFLLSRFPYEARPADVIIVPGARVKPDGEPSNVLLYRLQAAKKAYDKGMASAIIVSGGMGKDEPVSEAVSMKAWLGQNGIPENAVLTEPDSKNTIENLKNAKAIMHALGAKTAIITTTDYHTARTMFIANRLRIRASAFSAKGSRKPSTIISSYARESASWVLCLWLAARGRIG